jgi:hypothetical protein
MRARSLALRTAATLASACMLLAWVGVSWGQPGGKAERQRRKYEPPPQALAPAAVAKAEAEAARAWRLQFRGWVDGTLFLTREGGGAVEMRVGGEGEGWDLAADGARSFLLHDRHGYFMAYVEGAGDAMGSVIKLDHGLAPLPLTEAGVAEVRSQGSEIVLTDGRRYEVSAEDRPAAAGLAGQSAGASVVAEEELVIWGLPGPGPVLDVKRLN